MVTVRWNIVDNDTSGRPLIKELRYGQLHPVQFLTRDEADAYIAEKLAYPAMSQGRFQPVFSEVPGRRTRTLTGKTSTGHTVTIRTSGSYDLAFVAIYRDQAQVMAKGSSPASVRSRGLRACYGWKVEGELVNLREEVHPVIAEYFERRPVPRGIARTPRVESAFGPAGWEALRRPLLPTRHTFGVLRQLGYTAVSVGVTSANHVADFTIQELTKRAA